MQRAGEFTLDIGSVVVQTEAERERLQGATPVLERAFSLLAERLARTPFRQFGEAGTRAKALALDRLQIDSLSLDELMSPRGAERLADELYRQMQRSVR